MTWGTGDWIIWRGGWGWCRRRGRRGRSRLTDKRRGSLTRHTTTTTTTHFYYLFSSLFFNAFVCIWRKGKKEGEESDEKWNTNADFRLRHSAMCQIREFISCRRPRPSALIIRLLKPLYAYLHFIIKALLGYIPRFAGNCVHYLSFCIYIYTDLILSSVSLSLFLA